MQHFDEPDVSPYMDNRNVAVFGLGWLGIPLAHTLKNIGFNVYAGTRNSNKINKFNELGFNTFQISFDIESVQIQLNKNQIDTIRYLIICLPPSNFHNYSSILGSIVSHFNSNTKVIFISSIGIYEDANSQLTEDSNKEIFHPVYLAEQKLIELDSSRLTIIRAAGLIGENRHPVKYFIQKGFIPNSNAPVNLVCQKDVIRAIILIIKKDIFGEIYNIVNPYHPSKKDYYLAAAKYLFNDVLKIEYGNGGKLVIGTKFVQQTGFRYLYDLDNWKEFFYTRESN